MPFRNRIITADEIDTSDQGSGTGVWIRNDSVEYYHEGELIGIDRANFDGVFDAPIFERIVKVSDAVRAANPSTILVRDALLQLFRWATGVNEGKTTAVFQAGTIEFRSSSDGHFLFSDGPIFAHKGVQIGANTSVIKQNKRLDISFDAPSILAGADASWLIPAPGVQPGDIVIYTAGLIRNIAYIASVAETNEIRLRVVNASSVTVDLDVRTYTFWWIDLT